MPAAALRGASLTIEIPLTRGAVALVDAEDFHLVARYKWSLHSDGYAKATPIGLMHRLILDAPPGVIVDHENLDGLDNRRSNLRLATISQNHANTLGRGSSSGYKGVCFDRRRRARPWKAQLRVDGEHRWLGSYATAEEAARAYDVAAHEAFGPFARCNFEAVS